MTTRGNDRDRIARKAERMAARGVSCPRHPNEKICTCVYKRAAKLIRNPAQYR